MNIVDEIAFFIKNSLTNEERLENIKKILQKSSIDFFEQKDKDITNIVCKGTGNLWFSAHWDTVHPEYSAIDNTGSVFSLINLKRQLPEANIVLFDKEEPPHMGKGSELFCKSIDKTIKMVNLDVIGVGNIFALKKLKNDFTDEVSKLFNFDVFSMPFTDADICMKNGIDSIMMAGIYKFNNGTYDNTHWHYCHTSMDKPSLLEEEQFSLMFSVQKELINRYN